jgi:hypothetical protein
VIHAAGFVNAGNQFVGQHQSRHRRIVQHRRQGRRLGQRMLGQRVDQGQGGLRPCGLIGALGIGGPGRSRQRNPHR